MFLKPDSRFGLFTTLDFFLWNQVENERSGFDSSIAESMAFF